jgi:hypothetical protein
MGKYGEVQPEVSVCADNGSFCERLSYPRYAARLRYNAGDGVGDVCARRDGQEPYDESGDANGAENDGDGDENLSDNAQLLQAKQNALARSPNSHCLSGSLDPRSSCSSSLWSRFV